MTKEKIARNELIVELHKRGLSLREIASRINISHERIRQILRAHSLSTAKKLTPKTDRNILIRD